MSESSGARSDFQAPRPGPEHEVFLKDVGVWDATVEVKLAPAPQISSGEARNSLACGGLWLVTEFRNESGFEGRGLYGYDPARGKYVGTWIDSMRTFMVLSDGEYDASTRTMILRTEHTDPTGRTMRWREVTRTVDDDTQVWSQIMTAPDGREFETMTVTYRRKK